MHLGKEPVGDLWEREAFSKTYLEGDGMTRSSPPYSLSIFVKPVGYKMKTSSAAASMLISLKQLHSQWLLLSRPVAFKSSLQRSLPAFITSEKDPDWLRYA